MKQVKGWTLIELVIVIVILGILAAIVVPKYVDLSASALAASKTGMTGSVRSALAIAIADTKGNVNVTTLASYLADSTSSAALNGISVTINGNSYVVPTYTDSKCTTPTNALTATVLCVGSIP